MGKITITKGDLEVDIPGGELVVAVPIIREIIAGCDKKKDLKVLLAEKSTGDGFTVRVKDGKRQERFG